MRSQSRPFRFAAILAVVYAGAANSWWHYRNDHIVAGNLASEAVVWLGHLTNFLWVPGWGLIHIVHDGPPTLWSDLLIPALGSLFWGWMILFALRLVEYVRSNRRWTDLTRVAKFEFAAECALIISITACIAGMYLNSNKLYLIGLFASSGLIVAVICFVCLLVVREMQRSLV